MTAAATSVGVPKDILDDLPFSPFQYWSVLLTAAAVILDGLDNQMLGLAAPSLLREWGIRREGLGVVFALGFVGMGIGTLVAGYVGDRFGRRGSLIMGVAIFGVATLLTGFSTALWQVAALKMLAGVGLGGVPGTASAMISELTPSRWRSIAVTFGVVCVSIGGIFGGLAATLILPALGWRWLFYIGGVVTLLFVALLYAALTESPSYLATRPDRADELGRVLDRIGYQGTAPMIAMTRVTGASLGREPMRALFGEALRRDTVALSVAMFAGMFMIYLMFNWAPTMLTSAGFSEQAASLGLTCFNIGGTIGALLASLATLRLGSRPVLIVMAIVGALASGTLAALRIDGGSNQAAMLACLLALGLFASAAQSAMFAVGAHAFPTGLRARGLGLMGASGRVGALLSALVGATLTDGGNQQFFGVLAALMLVNAVGFASIRGHIPKLIRPKQGPVT